MSMTPRIGIIGGNGWIGGALARTLVETGVTAETDLILSCRSAAPGWLPGATWTHDNQALAEAADIVVLSVRPRDWPEIAVPAADKLVISVMAAVPAEEIAAGVGSPRVVRALPNAAIEVRKSYTPWFATAAVTEADKAIVGRILGACGTEDEVPTERDIDYLTGHSGTGPAYPALLATALMRDAIERGLPPRIARRAAVGMLIGAGRLFEAKDADPADLVQSFVDYRGVTAAALETMRRGGFEDLVGEGLSAALEKTAGLAPKS